MRRLILLAALALLLISLFTTAQDQYCGNRYYAPSMAMLDQARWYGEQAGKMIGSRKIGAARAFINSADSTIKEADRTNAKWVSCMEWPL